MKILVNNVKGKLLDNKSRPGYPVYVANKSSFVSGTVEVSKEYVNSIGNYSIGYYNGESLKNKDLVGYTDTICLDFDGTLFLEPILERLEGYKYVVATTSSHLQPSKGERYRVFVELDKEYGTDKLELYPYVVKEAIKLMNFEGYTDDSVDSGLTGWLFRSPTDMEYYEGEGEQLVLKDLMKLARLEKFKIDEIDRKKKEERKAEQIVTQEGIYTNDIEIELPEDGGIMLLSEMQEGESCICPTCNEHPHSAYIILDEDTDLPLVTCRRTHCKATHKLREVPKLLEKRTIEGIEQSEETILYKDVELVNLPLDTEVVQHSLESTWTTVPYGHYPSKFNEAHKVIFSTLNTVVRNNKEGIGGRYIIPAPTGIGKTTGTAHYVAELAKVTPRGELGVCIVTKFIDEAIEFEKQINILLEDYDIEAKAIHSRDGGNVAAKDYRKYPIIIITHVNFENKIKEVQSWATEEHITRREEPNKEGLEPFRFKRNLLIIDEALSLIEEDSISTNSLDELKFQLNTCREALGNTWTPKQEEEYQWLVGMHKELLVISEEVKEYTNKIVPLKITAEALGLSDYGEPVYEMTNLKRWVSSKQVEPHKMALKLGQPLSKKQYKLKDKELRNRWLGELERFHKALMQTDWAIYRDKELTLWSIKDIFPSNMSYAILDATGDLDYSLKLENSMQNITVIEGFENLRDYSNYTLNYIRMRTGKEFLKDNPEVLPRFIALGNKLNPTKEEPTIIATAKQFKEKVDSMIGEDTELFRQAHFGNVTGKNLWKDCRMGIYLGQFHKPYYFAKNRIALATSTEDMVTLSGSSDETKYELYNVTQDFIQLINRQNVRVVDDLDGGCKSNTGLCTIPTGADGDLMLEILKSVMTGINLVELPYSDLGLVEPVKYKGGNVELLIGALNRVVHSTGIEKSIKVMLEEAGLTQEQWKNLKRGKHFITNLNKEGFDLIGRSRTSKFIKIDKE